LSLAKTLKIKRDFTRITLSLASPEAILERSYGEVLKPETINYRSFKPEKDGLFCEKIFGPVKDWECACGKYKRIRYKGIVCDRCGVEVTQKAVRRERFGHITLAVPVVHIWYFRSIPNKIGLLLGLTSKEVEQIVYYEKYVVVQAGAARQFGIEDKQLLTEDEYLELVQQLPRENQQLDDQNPDKFIAKMGGEAIEMMLKRIDLDALYQELRQQAMNETSQQRKREALKRLQVVNMFREANERVPNRPEWMVLRVIPVIPPELRPLVPLEGGRFATSDLNDLYRRVIIRNNRLKRLMDIRAPEVILRNEKRMLQEAVDALFDNSRKGTAVKGDSNRPLKSLSDMLKGKQGRFRQNLLGKRVDYSGRSVIVVGPELKLHECGLPKEMAIELFKPFVIRKLIERGIVKTVKSARRVIDRRDPVIWDILEKVIDGHPVLLNRAPTLHRISIQAFQPVLIEGKAIQLHPLVCAAFNADFDGDQMAVHVPLSHDACLEAMLLMLSSHNIISPANGQPIAVPSQDMVLGMYYLTKARPGARGEGRVFSSPEEALIAYDQGVVDMHARVKVRLGRELVETTIGRVLFNQLLPPEVGFVNELLTKKNLKDIIYRVYKACGIARTAQFLDDLKQMGFEVATRAGISFTLEEIIVPEEKEQIVQETLHEVAEIRMRYEMGFITDNERYNQVIDAWTRAINRVSEILYRRLAEDQQGFNGIFMMLDSGARGSKDQIKQLGGMRGLMAKPQKSLTGGAGEIIEHPIIANFKEGLSVLEYFISTHGARKGLADTALKTADAGYLTRRLVDVAQDVVVTMEDCGTLRGIHMTALKDNEEIVEPLADRIIGRVSVHDVYDPLTDELIVSAGEEITEEIADRIANTSIEMLEVRSPLTCEAPRGVCAKCYGRNLATGRMVQIGEAVGIIAAQSIGEPGTQLTLRTFHVGGTAARLEAESNIKAKFSGRVRFDKIRYVLYDDGEEEHQVVINRGGQIEILDENNRVIFTANVPYGSELLVADGATVERGQILCRWDPWNSVIVSEVSGTAEWHMLEEDVTYRSEVDEHTGHRDITVIEPRDKTFTPMIVVRGEHGVKEYPLPVKARVVVQNGQRIQAGQVIAKIPREMVRTKDITGGLPRVIDLFEARQPANPAIVSHIDGFVRMGERKRGQQEIIITARDGQEERRYMIPLSRHILVQDGDFVNAGDPLTDGPISPQDILDIKGPGAVQEYLVNQIQEVYRMQGVKIADKHIEIIVRQMMQKVQVEDPGDTKFLEGELVDRTAFNEENEFIYDKLVVADPGDSNLRPGDIISKRRLREINSELKRQDRRPVEVREARPATSRPILLGITEAALRTQSWVSAASFQETTRVLADAAVAAKTDLLLGLKENVIVGHPIPAGTGWRPFRNVLVGSKRELEALREGRARVVPGMEGPGPLPAG